MEENVSNQKIKLGIIGAGANTQKKHIPEFQKIKDVEIIGVANRSIESSQKVAKEFNIPIHYCKNINDPLTIQWIKNKQPDIIFCWGWSQIIQKDLLSLPNSGIVGVHPALLPKNRGRHPLIWSLVLGLRESGLTFFFMDEGADSGPILSQERFLIEDEDTAKDLYKKIKVLATKQIAKFLHSLLIKIIRHSIKIRSKLLIGVNVLKKME